MDLSMVSDPQYSISTVVFLKDLSWALSCSLYMSMILSNLLLFSSFPFADDICALMSSSNIKTLVLSVNREIAKVSTWFKANKLSLNIAKTNYIIFRSRNKRVPHDLPHIIIDNLVISKLKNIKFLGVTFNELMDWSIHISEICKSLSKYVGILYKLKFILPSNILNILYSSLILPHLNYCNCIWGNTYKSRLLKPYILQKKSIRLITKSHMQSASKPLFKKMNILPLHELITLNTLIFMYSVKNHIFPLKYCNMFSLNLNVHSYATRQKDNFHVPKVRLSSSLNSLALVGIKKWNQLPTSLKDCSTVSCFKKMCRAYLMENL
ncbi:uncharacterized protein LOC121423667 [Lytechinus variegatus]|uniref:uncharacterized protein LOC121423667 n=1 Tax=Lytechinus variegatus TaxID=7654 RepID=UPI001BB22230|nr:uncharacterized protein LOC121423667 [Lytechinus variegatus]